MDQTPAGQEGSDSGGASSYVVWLIVISTAINIGTAASNAVNGRKQENYQKELMAKVHDNQIERDRLAQENRDLRVELAKFKEEAGQIRKQP